MYNPESEIELMEDFRRGDQRAYKIIYNSYYYVIYGFARRFIQNDPEAEDITAETFLKLWRLHANFETTGNIKAFLYITTRNACLDYFKYKRSQSAREQELFYLLSEDYEKAFAQEEAKSEALKQIHNAIESLPEKTRQVMQLSVAGMKNGEIAKKLNVSIQTVMNQKVEALKRIRLKILEKKLLPVWGYLFFYNY